jgi:hypothetical protein
MAYRIQESDGFVEVHVWGKTSKWELLDAVHRLRSRDPRKEIGDLWVIAEESMVPLDAFPEIVAAIARFCFSGIACARSAIVAGGPFHKTLLDFYGVEARVLPFEVGVFTSRDEAIAWLNDSKPAEPVRGSG